MYHNFFDHIEFITGDSISSLKWLIFKWTSLILHLHLYNVYQVMKQVISYENWNQSYVENMHPLVKPESLFLDFASLFKMAKIWTVPT